MSAENLGNSVFTVQPFAGGEARFYERGVIISRPGLEVEVSFKFPMIGRPHIATGAPSAADALPRDAVSFPAGPWDPNEVGALVREALKGRLYLMPSEPPSNPVEPAFGPAADAGDGNYNVPASAALLERKLYDVALRDDANHWHVVAPNAVYYRSSWHDFGIAHITDMHVARRIDGFRGRLAERGLHEAARNLINWNDRFRGFVRYANFMHRLGVLDVIVATGDLIDYIYESGDQEAGTSNAEFLRDLILGKAPGPDFPNVERLRVPIFMVPGNHDYRRHPYRLIFNLDAGPFNVKKLRNYSGYNIQRDDAIALSVASGDNLEIPEVSAASAQRMVEVEPEPHWRTSLIPQGSYVVELGDHRLVMVDSAEDVGITEGKLEALKVRLFEMGEDKETFVGGSPNCEGVDEEAFFRALHTLNHMPPNGLFILGIHAPLLNVTGNAYPYFLRETQRPVHQRQVECFLLNNHRALIPPTHNPFELVRSRHPEWFGRVSGEDDTYFVKRGSTDDLLDFGVSRGRAEYLLRVLAGIDSERKGDVVLAGHTHCHNEFRIGVDPQTGQLVYYMDFYTANPRRYYPTRFFTGEVNTAGNTSPTFDNPGLLYSRPESDVTYVEVTPEAERNAAPWPLPHEANYKYNLRVPTYYNPLSDAADPRAWWASHRPLILQTASLGPLDKTTGPSFTGFRVLSVRNDVIEKIHFIPTARLEQNGYDLAWEEAIKPEPERRYKYIERSRYFNGPRAVGTPASVTLASGMSITLYRDPDNRLHELWASPDGQVGTGDLTGVAQATPIVDDPSVYLNTNTQKLHALYRGSDGHIHCIYATDGGAGHDNLSGVANAPKAAAGAVPSGFYTPAADLHHVVYRGHDNKLYTMYWRGADTVAYESASAAAPGAPLAKGNPSAYLDTNNRVNLVAYRGTDDHIHTFYWSDGPIGHDNLSAVAQAPLAAGDPVAYYISSHPHGPNFANVAHSVNQVTYRSVDGELIELWWVGQEPVQHGNLTRLSNGPKAVSDPVAYYDPVSITKHVFYYAADGHLHEIWWHPGTSHPQDIDLTVGALAPPAARARPSAYVSQNPNRAHVVYRGADSQLHEIFWA